MRNIKELPGRPKTAPKVRRLQAAELGLEPEVVRQWSILEEIGGVSFLNGEPTSFGRTQNIEDVEGHRLFSERSMSASQVIYSSGEERPLPIRDAVIKPGDRSRVIEVFSGILKREIGLVSS